MGLFDKLKGPVFLKEDGELDRKLEKLKEIEPLLNEEGQGIIRQDIRKLEYGVIGERNVIYELKNSHMPMYILHDLYLEDGDLSAQIDYLVFTKKICFIIECKNLYGNLEINNNGDFIRTMIFNGKQKKEGIYSPITQNQRHLELMKKIKTDNENSILKKYMTNRSFEEYNRSVVVLANTKTVLNARYAKKEVKEKVIRIDQLINYIKDMYDKSNRSPISEQKLLTWAQSYLSLHKELEKDYTLKYKKYITNNKIPNIKIKREYETIEELISEKDISEEIEIEETEIFKELKSYRLQKSREERIKPYFIYNDSQLKDLIYRMPKNHSELQKVSGFGKIKTEKYGEDIIDILAKY